MHAGERDSEVFGAIAREPVPVEFFAIDLERHALFNHDVDGHELGDRNLRSNGEAAHPESGSREAFGKTRASGVGPPGDASEALRQTRDELEHFEIAEGTRVTSPIECRDGDLPWLIEDHAD